MSKTISIYQQLMESIEKKIVVGELKIGDKIESERTMSEKYGINRMTVRNAIKHLEKSGVLESVRGSGTYVKSVPQIESTIDLGKNSGSLSLSAQIRQKGMKSSRILISMDKIKPEETVKDAFPNEDEVYEIIRMSLINDKPYALQKVYIPCSVFFDAERFDFETGSLYDYMEDRGHRPRTVISYLKIDKLPDEYKQIMNESSYKNFFCFEYYGFDKGRKLVEYTYSYHHPKYTTFKYDTTMKVEN